MKKFIVSEKNDYTLIKEIKEKKNISKNLEILYGRYYGMIRKHSRLLISKFKFYDNSETQKDFEQDCFLIMLESISSVNLKKISHFKDEWLFIKYFWYYIMNLKKKYICERVNNRSYSLEKIEETNPLSYNQDFKEIYREIYEFIKNTELISLTQKIIFKYRCEGYSINEIKNKVKLSYGSVHFNIFKLSNIVKNNFQYYVI